MFRSEVSAVGVRLGGVSLTSPAMTGSYEGTFAVVDALARSIYEARRSDRCAPLAAADGSRRMQQSRADDSAAEPPRAQADGQTFMQELIDRVCEGCLTDDLY